MPPKTHGLLYLWEQLEPNPLQDLGEEISLLNLFYAPTRYPDALPGNLPEGYPGKETAEKALDWASAIFQRARDYVQHSLSDSVPSL
ncbi:MAG: HEPN domain-containing protein [Armatimonadota bacterium]|nr:HEPN domain-containing protein [Armatimonadota bacterium]